MDLLIFDLDGTLVDSKLDLAISVNAALAASGRPTLDDELIQSYVGNGAPILIRRAVGPEASGAEVKSVLKLFMEHYAEHLLDNTDVYPGIRESLDRFRAAGKKMAVLTNKPTSLSLSLVNGLDLQDYFFRVYGGDSLPEKKPHPLAVERLLEESAVAKENALMIGDSSVDILTARNAAIAAAGVTYGFKPETLNAPPPDILVDRMEELVQIVFQRCTSS